MQTDGQTDEHEYRRTNPKPFTPVIRSDDINVRQTDSYGIWLQWPCCYLCYITRSLTLRFPPRNAKIPACCTRLPPPPMWFRHSYMKCTVPLLRICVTSGKGAYIGIKLTAMLRLQNSFLLLSPTLTYVYVRVFVCGCLGGSSMRACVCVCEFTFSFFSSFSFYILRAEFWKPNVHVPVHLFSSPKICLIIFTARKICL